VSQSHCSAPNIAFIACNASSDVKKRNWNGIIYRQPACKPQITNVPFYFLWILFSQSLEFGDAILRYVEESNFPKNLLLPSSVLKGEPSSSYFLRHPFSYLDHFSNLKIEAMCSVTSVDFQKTT
jgi:hypothetical protein